MGGRGGREGDEEWVGREGRERRERKELDKNLNTTLPRGQDIFMRLKQICFPGVLLVANFSKL